MSGELSWYVARAGGLLAWALSAFSILWGLLITSRALGKRISGPRLLDLHRFIGGLSVVFVAVHIVGLRLHRYQDIHFGFKDIFVPMASSWHPGAVAYGIVAMYLLIAVEITSLLRRKLPASLWRRLHYTGFVVFLLGSIHALKVGTDVQNPVIWWPSAVVCAAVVGLAVTRAMAAAQIAAAKAAEEAEEELASFGSPGVSGERLDDPWAAPAATAVPMAPVAARLPVAAAAAPADSVAEALATTRRVDDDRAALLERTRRSLERLDITAYPRAELPAELLTTRPTQPAAAPETDPEEVVLPTRPVMDIALRYARLRNPANPQTAPPPSFQAVIPPGANTQSNWGQPPAGWGAPAATAATRPFEANPPAPVEARPKERFSFEPIAEPIAEPVAEPIAQPTAFADVEPPAPVAPPPANIGLPDPNSRTAWQDQLQPQVSSLDWRTPTPRPENAVVAARVESDLEADRDDAPEPTLTNVRSGLPSRTPQRLARSTQPARNPLDWKPQRLDTAPMGGAPPPPTPDPLTGEVPSEQYRAWLREWLAFAESYDG
jgi:DMSO/TMAO reductase YedYZ heme-binding membrane subunit